MGEPLQARKQPQPVQLQQVPDIGAHACFANIKVTSFQVFPRLRKSSVVNCVSLLGFSVFDC